MLEKLKRHWNVNSFNLILIICTFALGGSLCGYAGRKLLELTGMDKGVLWVLIYIALITLLWPISVLLISIPLGQFSFFQKYISKVWRRMSGNAGKITSFAIFASGAGTNAQKIIDSSLGEKGAGKAPAYKVALIVCNKPGAGVTRIAETNNIPVLLIDKERFFKGDGYLAELQKYHIDFIVLAGFLWHIPPALIERYRNKIINIHPALLPKYGGKGMYGNRVHETVIASGDKESGITIHYVDELYDHGVIILQAKCSVNENETPATLAKKIHALEHQHFPSVISDLVQMQNRS